VVFLSAGAACVPNPTRVAVRNESNTPITVALRSPETASMRFSDVPSLAASPLEVLRFGALTGVVVEVRDGAGKSGAVKLERGMDNIIVIREDAPPTVRVPGRPELGPVESDAGVQRDSADATIDL
jgi:hypothetical protein